MSTELSLPPRVGRFRAVGIEIGLSNPRALARRSDSARNASAYLKIRKNFVVLMLRKERVEVV
mgnify:CR=1 FL=1